MLNKSMRLAKRWLWDTKARLIFGVGISLVLGWLSVRGMEWGLVIDQFQDFPIGWAIASLLIVVAASIVRAYRWQVLFIRDRVPLVRLFLVQNAGLGLNNLVPIRVASEGAQFAILTLRYRVDGGVALATLGVERVLDLVVTAALLMAGLTLLPSKGDFIPYVVGAFVIAILSLLLIPILIWASKKPMVRRIPILVSTTSSLVEMLKAKGSLAYSLLITLVSWVLIGISAWVLAYGIGVDITPFVATLAVLGTLYFVTSLPALPAAAGTFEFAMVYVLKFFGVSQALAFSYSVVVHAVLFLPPIIVAIIYLSAIGIRSPRQKDLAQPGEGYTLSNDTPS